MGEGSRTGGSALLPVQHTFTHVCAPLKPILPQKSHSAEKGPGSPDRTLVPTSTLQPERRALLLQLVSDPGCYL